MDKTLIWNWSQTDAKSSTKQSSQRTERLKLFDILILYVLT